MFSLSRRSFSRGGFDERDFFVSQTVKPIDDLIDKLIGKRNLSLKRKKRFLSHDETRPDFVFILFGKTDFLFFKSSRVFV